jgi:hypothetical protein
VPELHLDAAVQRPALGRLVGGGGLRGAAPVAVDRGGRQVEGVPDRQRDAVRPGLRERDVGAVDAFRPARERHVVRVPDELHRHVPLVPEVVQRLADLTDELLLDAHGRVVEVQRRDQVPHPRAVVVPLAVPELADRLHPADLDPLDLLGDDDLREADLLPDLVVPDLDLDAPVQRAPLGGGVRGDRLAVAGPLEGDRLRRETESGLEELRGLADALPGEPRVDPGEGARQRLVVGVPHQVEPHVLQVLHAAQDAPEPLHGAGRNLRDAGRVSDRRNHAGELGDLDVVRDHLPLLQPVAEFGVE